jgi:hypothetical protein
VSEDRRRYALDRHSDLKEKRAIEEPHWRDIALLFRPDDRDFDAHIQRRRDDTAIFDATQIYALDNFAGGLFSQMTNPMNKWMGLGIADKDLQSFQPVATWLARQANRILATFTDAVSPFYSEVPAWFSNVGAFGWGPMYNEEIPGEAKIVDRAIPIGESYIDIDAQGYVDTFHREFSLTGRQAKAKVEFRGSSDVHKLDDKGRTVFVHCVWPNPEFVPGRLGPKGKAFASAYVSPDVQDLYIDGGYYELPYHVPFWNRRSGRAYPTGPGHIARADASMLQEMERSHVVAAQFNAEPPILAHSLSTILAHDIEPNAVLYGTMNETVGKRTIEYLERKQDVKLSLQQSEQRRNAIRQAFLFSILQLLDRPEMTATEFLGFSKEFLQLAAHRLAGLQHGGLSPLIARRWRMLERAGQIEPPPQELAGHALTVEYESPLAKLMKVAEAQGVAQWINAIAPVIAAKPEAADVVDADRVITILREGFVTDPSVISDPDTVAKLRQSRAEQQQQALQLQGAEQAANIGATVAHAQQAGSLARKRLEAA